MYNVIIFFVITFDENTYDVKVFSTVYYIIKFTTFVIAFADNVMRFCIK